MVFKEHQKTIAYKISLSSQSWDHSRLSPSNLGELPDANCISWGIAFSPFLVLPMYFMKVLIPDDRRGQRDSLRQLAQNEREVQISGIAEYAESAPERVLARELRLALDGCPICDGGYRDHSFTILSTVIIEQDWQSPLRLKQYYDLLHAHHWQELLRLREWNEAADILVGFAFRCAQGRVGVVTIISPAKPDLPDTPLHYMILPEEDERSLLSLVPAERWHPLRSVFGVGR